MIKIFDTTLRDGEQSPGCSMNIQEKIQMAKQLERLGVDVIEAGFAISSPEDFRSVEAIASAVKKPVVCSLARCNREDITRAWEAVSKGNRPRIHVFIATSDIHLKYKLEMTREEVLAKVTESVSYAKSLCKDIEFSCEDASRSDWDFLVQVSEAAIASGATVINLPDTVGYSTPEEYGAMIAYVKNHAAGIEKVEISVHCHNDLGLAVANSLAAVKAGATQIECTVSGIGERAGNAGLEECVMALRTRKDYYGVETSVNTREIMNSAKLLSTIIGQKIPPNKSITGENAFAHESGIHQQGILKEKSTYEIMRPEDIGLKENKIVLGKHSGKYALRDRLLQLGYEVIDEELGALFPRFKDVADVKKKVYDEDLIALMMGEFNRDEEGYRLIDYMTTTRDGKDSMTIIKVMDPEGNTLEEVGSGKGPIDAAFACMEKITGADVKLTDFSIHSITSGKDALGETFIKLSQGDSVYAGKGVSNDIIKSGIIAYINAINKRR